MKHLILHSILMLLLCNKLCAQRMHLELGATAGFKDEFFLNPEFATGANFAEFHIVDLSAFARVSKLRWGGELDLGFEKAADYFVRYDGSTSASDYFNLNRLKTGFYGHYYLLKTAKNKWDLQMGCTNYFNFSPLYLDAPFEIRTWKLTGRAAVNYTFKSFICGVFYEYSFRNDYSFRPPNALFGARLGVIY